MYSFLIIFYVKFRSTFLNTVKIATCFLFIDFWEVLCIYFWIRFLLSDRCFVIIFSQSVDCIFNLLTVSLEEEASLILMESICSLIDCAWILKTKNVWITHCHVKFSIFSPRNFDILSVIFRFIHFLNYFLNEQKYESKFYFFLNYVYSLLYHHLLKWLTFLSELFRNFVKN